MAGKIDAVLFDFGGTLDFDGVDWFTRFYDYVVSHIGGNEPHKLNFFTAMKQAAMQMSDMNDIMSLNIDQTVIRWTETTHAIITAEKGHDSGNWDPMLVAADFMSDSHKIIERNHGVLSELAREYRLGCISNNWGNIAGWCSQVNYDSFFEVMVDSARENSIKPDPAIFQVALQKMGLNPARTVYVGDRYDADVIGSSSVGMIPLWLTGGTETIENDIVYMDYGLRQWQYIVKPAKIRSLTDVLQISELF
ncbi:MAG: HAD family hydrolase [Sedimentisphaerales bacterium]|nr:HAD family hydrolase [Sedimentisphaerales bacterium]MBN2843995.1 HAD family hydrolase [Sedimentisphaerales bacterium]